MFWQMKDTFREVTSNVSQGTEQRYGCGNQGFWLYDHILLLEVSLDGGSHSSKQKKKADFSMSTVLVGQIVPIMKQVPVYILYIRSILLNEKSYTQSPTDICAHKTELQS